MEIEILIVCVRPPLFSVQCEGALGQRYTSSMLSGRVLVRRRSRLMQPCSHLEAGSVALQTLTLQWKKT